MLPTYPPRSIWPAAEGALEIIDQRWLPHEYRTEQLTTLAETTRAIEEMRVRGAPLIGVTAAYGLYLALREAPSRANYLQHLAMAAAMLKATRPTAINLAWAVDRMVNALTALSPDILTHQDSFVQKARELADEMAEADVATCRAIGEHGYKILEALHKQHPDRPVQMLTHCNAGGLGCVAYGTATAPLYLSAERGLPVHVWVDETRPRNQGALTAFELKRIGIPHTYIVDNAGGLLMQRGQVDVVIVGADRVSLGGDVANKIGTYLKALAAKDNQVPFYVALPASTFDPKLKDAFAEIPIEERHPDEVNYAYGINELGKASRVLLTPEGTKVSNPGFDITPARLITGLLTERGTCPAKESAVRALYPEFA
jgi:methylthioribose-1-phosphate isomerase